MSKTARTQPKILMRNPDSRDGAALWRIAGDSQSLDLNSPYAYLMWCDYFAKTSLVAEVDGWPAAFLMGFRPPERPHVLFVWQVAVADEHRGCGLAGKMLAELFEREPTLRALEATVTPSNTASRALFTSFARRRGWSCAERPYLSSEHFPTRGHEPEVLFQIGPNEVDR